MHGGPVNSKGEFCAEIILILSAETMVFRNNCENLTYMPLLSVAYTHNYCKHNEYPYQLKRPISGELSHHIPGIVGAANSKKVTSACRQPAPHQERREVPQLYKKDTIIQT